MDLVDEVQKKKEFRGLPDSVVERALEKSSGDVKEARNFLRKYFGVFLTNRVLKGRDLLKSHFSSRKRDYGEFYGRIFEKIKTSRRFPQISADYVSVLDLGCGVNGFSYEELANVLGDVQYVGVEAAGQLVEFMNSYFEDNGFNGKALRGDLMDLDFVKNILKLEKFEVCFLFQVVDALESFEKNYSKKLISLIMNNVSFLVISLPVVSLGGRKRIGDEKRKWLVDWLREEFEILDDFVIFGERMIVVGR